jgi:Protein of unknown function (DUF1553)/Protein of unknown function (DUF1549)/Planctomycete cytochrome C/Concanavalin A-like lectin/glucanases superfamily
MLARLVLCQNLMFAWLRTNGVNSLRKHWAFAALIPSHSAVRFIRDRPLVSCICCFFPALALPLNADDSTRVAVWNFGTEESTPLTLHGGVQRDQAGPRPPEFPDFAGNNTSVKFEGVGYVSVPDPGTASKFDFTNGDAVTLEAWVRLNNAREGRLMYVIGKGRTGSPQFARDNQNWALRLVSDGNGVHLSFLFATPRGASSSHWHRWTSEHGFAASTGWHHVSVGYRFGEPDSIRGWIDGIPSDGKWDMGGATTEAPVVDDDEVWIGSASGGRPGNSFDGWLDAVAVHRVVLEDNVVAAHFNRVGGPRTIVPLPEVVPELKGVPRHRVLTTVSEQLPSHTRWLNEGESWPAETARWSGEAFLLHRLPATFDNWGIRASWKAPVLLRVATDVELPAGEHRFLLRARGLSRLWVDGEIVARTTSDHRQRTNLEAVEPVSEPPVPGGRRRPFAQQDSFGVKHIAASADNEPRAVRVVLELIVGGKDLRTETGEVCVAVQSHKDEPFFVLRGDASSPLPLTDDAIDPAIREIERVLVRYEDEVRRTAAASQDVFWHRRHELAGRLDFKSAVATGNASGEVGPDPRRPSTMIDSYLAAKIERSLARAATFDEKSTQQFYTGVLPILREQCFRCHGQKQQGGLRLNSRQHALASGDSESPAVVPGDPDASELMVRIRGGEMPPNGQGPTTDQVALIEQWIRDGAEWPPPPIPDESVAVPAIVDDASFLRRVYLDTVGVPPTTVEARAFLADDGATKRQELIDELLDDDRFADQWISFWMDLLAENPSLLNASLNSTGPFRWFLHDSLRDRKPLDRMVTELILMRGGPHVGGSAGFGLAGENDAPLAAKGHILASAFLGIELQCARCHDSPYHSTTQEDLYSLAAMLNRKPATPPATSRVPDEFFQDKSRESLIHVSLKPGKAVDPKWPFASFTGIADGPDVDDLLQRPDDSRERLAALITAPGNSRFPRVFVNHVWKHLIGAGLVEPVNDWEGRTASHPALLDWLAHELTSHDYDQRHVIRLILNSNLYQRQAIGKNLDASPELRFFNAPDQRRLTAEQIVDSLYAATGSTMDVEELTFVHDGVHPISRRLTLGTPERAWEFASLNNERDRPSLSLPRAQPIVDVLQAFGWTGSRQKPIAERDTHPNVLQPGILANGTLSVSLTRAANGSTLSDLAVNARSSDELLDDLFLRFLCRFPNQEERESLSMALSAGFDERLTPPNQIKAPEKASPLPQITWTNHLVPLANEIQLEVQRRVRNGPAADPRLRIGWREVYEDVVWSLVNHSEFVWVP